MRSGRLWRCASRDFPVADRSCRACRAASQQLGLEARIGDAEQRLDDLLVAAPAQIRRAVLGDHDVAQVARDRDVPVVRHDVRTQRLACPARGADADDRARAGQLVGLGDEVVLPADAADDLAALQSVGDHRAAQRDHHAGVDEARVAPLQLAQHRVVDAVDAPHAVHADQLGLVARHRGQRLRRNHAARGRSPRACGCRRAAARRARMRTRPRARPHRRWSAGHSLAAAHQHAVAPIAPRHRTRPTASAARRRLPRAAIRSRRRRAAPRAARASGALRTRSGSARAAGRHGRRRGACTMPARIRCRKPLTNISLQP